MLTGKNYLITGATGSFGHSYVNYLLNRNAERIVVFSRDEVKQYEMSQKFRDDRLRFFIGDVRDYSRLKRAFEGVDVIIHAAALKRIETGFYNPAEMVKTNVIGAMNVIDAAHDAGVKKVVALSTDKAFQPISAYGHSKALAESLFLNANNASGANGPKFSVTRYGNVAFSRGSVIPKWIASGDTVDVTHPDATRFYMTIDEAVDLVAKTIETMPKNIVTPKLSAYRIGDLAEVLGKKINIIGLPEWEKMHESMIHGESSESAYRLSLDEIHQLVSSGISNENYK